MKSITLESALRQLYPEFGSLTRLNVTSQKIYRLTLSSGEYFGVKEFDHDSLFHLELLALVTLRDSGRVCPILESSENLQEYDQGEFRGPYFVVKPFYSRFLKGESSPLRAVERAAQLVDISRKFLDRTWRDFDGKFENDAIDEAGRIVRIDLDGAVSPLMLPSKFDPTHHCPSQVTELQDIRTKITSLFNAESEIESLVIRISRFLLRQDSNVWPLLIRVLKLAKHPPSDSSTVGAGDSSAGGRRWRVLLRWVGVRTNGGHGEGGSASEQVVARDLRELECDWLRAWESTVGSATLTTQNWQRLTLPEANLLGKLTFHLLTNSRHGFSFNDLYNSLLLTASAALCVRRPNVIKQDMHVVGQFSDLLADLPEIQRLLLPAQPPRTIDQVPLPFIAPPARDLRVGLQAAGDAWRATLKATDRECEDIVLVSSVPAIIVLADGASNANGKRAVEMVSDAFREWVRTYKPTTVAGMKESVRGFILAAHQKLRDYCRKHNAACETTLVLGTVFQQPGKAPTLLLGRLGNSGYLVTRTTASGGAEFLWGAINRIPTAPLGASEFRESLLSEFEETVLQEPGLYRIRAFSDGFLDAEEGAYTELAGSTSSISDVVQEAGRWDKKYSGQVGGDDWSVAGFDIVLEETRALPPPPQHVTARVPPAAEQPHIQNLAAQLDANCFVFSAGALEFWQRLLSGTDIRVKGLETYPLIRDVLWRSHLGGRAVDAEQEQEPAPEATRRRSRSNDNDRLFPRWTWWIVGATVVVVVWIFWLALRQSSDNVGQQYDWPGASVPPPPPPSTRFAVASQEKIYRQVQRGGYVLDGLAKGSALDEPLAALADDLEAVLQQTGWAVNIYVHTDIQGASDVNLRVSSARAEALANRILAKGRIDASRIRATGVGKERPIANLEGTAEFKAARSRRVEIQRVTDR